MPGLFSRVKHWVKEHLKTTDLNAEFDNVITNSVPAQIDDLSATVSDMRETEDPGEEGSENQAASFEEEIKQLRFQLKAIIGDAQWYSPPATSLGIPFSFSGIPQQRVLSGRVDTFNQPMFLVPDGTLAKVTLKATSVPLVGFINGSYAIFENDLSATGLSLAPSSDNTCLVNQYALDEELYSKQMGAGDLILPIDNIGSAIIARDKTRAAFKVVHGGSTEYFTAEIDYTNSCLKNAFRGLFFNSLDVNQPAIALSDNDTITLLNIGWAFALDESVQSLDVTYSQPAVSYDEPLNADYWFDLSTNVWKKNTAGTFSAVRALYLGYFVTDTTKCVVARSADFFRNHQPQNGITLVRAAGDRVFVGGDGAEVIVYGKKIQATGASFYWDMDIHLDTGVTEAASTTYYFYISDLGKRIISDVPPVNRYSDLLGAYHPSKPYRCVGSVLNDSSSNFWTVASEVLDQKIPPYSSNNAGLDFSTADGAMTIFLTTLDGSDPSPVNPIFVSFQETDYSDTVHKTYRIEAPLTYVVRSGQALGQTLPYGNTCTVYLGRQGKRIFLGVGGVNSHNPIRSEQSITSSEDVSTSGNRAIRIYADIFSSSGPAAYLAGSARCVAIAQFYNFQATPGTWASTPQAMLLDPKGTFGHPWYAFFGDFIQLSGNPNATVVGVSGSAAYGATNTKVRRFDDGYNNTTLSDNLSAVGFIFVTAAAGTSFVPARFGLFLMRYEDSRSGGDCTVGISRDGVGTTDYFSNTASRKMAGSTAAAGFVAGCTAMIANGEFPPVNAYFPHSTGTNDSTKPKLQIMWLGDLSYHS